MWAAQGPVTSGAVCESSSIVLCVLDPKGRQGRLLFPLADPPICEGPESDSSFSVCVCNFSLISDNKGSVNQLLAAFFGPCHKLYMTLFNEKGRTKVLLLKRLFAVTRHFRQLSFKQSKSRTLKIVPHYCCAHLI